MVRTALSSASSDVILPGKTPGLFGTQADPLAILVG